MGNVYLKTCDRDKSVDVVNEDESNYVPDNYVVGVDEDESIVSLLCYDNTDGDCLSSSMCIPEPTSGKTNSKHHLSLFISNNHQNKKQRNCEGSSDDNMGGGVAALGNRSIRNKSKKISCLSDMSTATSNNDCHKQYDEYA
eukprot:3541646-Ditylum_brightwellii.AAC.1